MKTKLKFSPMEKILKKEKENINRKKKNEGKSTEQMQKYE